MLAPAYDFSPEVAHLAVIMLSTVLGSDAPVILVIKWFDSLLVIHVRIHGLLLDLESLHLCFFGVSKKFIFVR